MVILSDEKFLEFCKIRQALNAKHLKAMQGKFRVDSFYDRFPSLKFFRIKTGAKIK